MKTIISTREAPTPIGPYNQAVLVGKTLYVSGQIALKPKNNSLVIEDIETETEQVMENLKVVLKAAKMTFSNVVKTSIFIKSMDDFEVINKVYGRYFKEKTAPARETVQVAGLPRKVNIEISLIAVGD